LKEPSALMNEDGQKLLSLEEALTMNRQELRENCARYLNPGLVEVLSLLNFDRLFVKAEGCSLWDEEGKQYLDCLGGYGALNLGHNPPEILAALTKVRQRPNLLQAALNPLAAALAANLAAVTPGDLSRVFFCNSGTEAVEGALKLARAHQPDKKKSSTAKILSMAKAAAPFRSPAGKNTKGPFVPCCPIVS
jgi:putrescine aminotransferase